MTDKVLYHLGISGGKDSTALLLWAVHESGLPRERIRATFCDTGNEAEQTYAHVRLLSETVFPVEWIKPELDFYELAAKKGCFPSARRRFCTQELKIEPTQKHIAGLMKDGWDVIALSGVRAAESAQRATLPERGWEKAFDCEVWRPLLSWKLADVWAIHERYGFHQNPLYKMGARRVGCLPCVMSRKKEIFMVGRNFAERIDRIREAETAPNGGTSTFFHSATVPPRYRSLPWQNKEGKWFQLATIDDVVRWAEDEYSVVQHDLFKQPGDFEIDEEEEPPTCESRMGFCE